MGWQDQGLEEAARDSVWHRPYWEEEREGSWGQLREQWASAQDPGRSRLGASWAWKHVILWTTATLSSPSPREKYGVVGGRTRR